MLRDWAITVILSLLPVLALPQETPSTPTGSQTQGDQAPPGPNRRGGEGRFQGVAGTITAIDKNQISLKTQDGKSVAVKLSSDTRYRKDRQTAALSDFKVGDMVMVGGDPAGENAWNARFVASRSGAGQAMREGLGKQFISGEIKAIEGTSLTILRVDGQTQTIQVDENTSFRKQGQSITLADFKPGDRVFGRGELKNGTFVAAVLNAGDPQQMGMPRPGSAPDRH
jgi:ribosomal protein L21E